MAAGISAALFARERTGEGDLVSTSLFRQGVYTIGFDVNVSLMWGVSIGVGTRTMMGNPAINNYTAGDGRRFWIVGLEGDRHWPPLARVVGHPEWIDDERFSTPAARFEHAGELIGLLDDIFATQTLDEWAEVFTTEPDFFWSPVQSIDELLSDEQFLTGGGLVEVPDGDRSTTMVATPVEFARHAAVPRGMAPDLGAHTRDLLGEPGCSDDEIDQAAEGLVVDAP
jgi:crotonobetainyl-CoA:carnitine CoA-transferase CaiB-like acyl-CoA transferase